MALSIPIIFLTFLLCINVLQLGIDNCFQLMKSIDIRKGCKVRYNRLISTYEINREKGYAETTNI